MVCHDVFGEYNNFLLMSSEIRKILTEKVLKKTNLTGLIFFRPKFVTG